MFTEESFLCVCKHLKAYHWNQDDEKGITYMGGRCFGCKCPVFKLDNLKYLEGLYLEKNTI